MRHDDGSVLAIVEQSTLTEEQNAIREINSSIYCFSLDKLWPCLASLKPKNVHKELYLTDAIAVLRQKGENVQAVLAADPDEVLGCNTRADLAAVDTVFRRRKRTALMDAGVTIELPETVLIDPDVTVGADTRIEPCVQLFGKTRVGAGCTIRTGSVLSDAVLEDNVLVKPYSIVSSESFITRHTSRPVRASSGTARAWKKTRACGNLIGVKKSVLGDGVKAMHLTYLGDARIGSGCNIWR